MTKKKQVTKNGRKMLLKTACFQRKYFQWKNCNKTLNQEILSVERIRIKTLLPKHNLLLLIVLVQVKLNISQSSRNIVSIVM